ncbi:DUF5375 domain-containing protein [Escherichia coli]|nr:DUF5375 domain-containing protein [Escherichia coli]EES4949747.1 DUF5375 domain-containing protein [Escherichia coli]
MFSRARKVLTYDSRAQCSPRHACPLKRSLLMQVHEPTQAAPSLSFLGLAVMDELCARHITAPVLH